MRLLALALGACLCAASDARAAPQLQVAPVVIELNAKQPIAALRLRNMSDAILAFETNAFSWTQADGQDELAPSPDVVAWPPAFVVPAGGEQIVRVALDGTRPGAVERAYRLVLSQAALQNDGEGLRMRLELSLPVFLAPNAARDEPPVLEWAETGQGRRLRTRNPGNRRVTLQGEGLPRYLLAGASALAPSNTLPHVRYASAAGVSAEAALGRTRDVRSPARP